MVGFMEQQELRCLRTFVWAVHKVMAQIPLPVPPRAIEGWPGISFLDAKEMYDAFNKLSPDLQEVVSRGFFMCANALEWQTSSAEASIAGLYVLISDISRKKGIDMKDIAPQTAMEWKRANRPLRLVEDIVEEESQVQLMRETENCVEELLWDTLSAKRNAIANDDRSDDDDPEPTPGAAFAVEEADGNALDDDTRDPHWRASRRKVALSFVAGLLIPLSWIWFGPDTSDFQSSHTRIDQSPETDEVSDMELVDVGKKLHSIDFDDMSLTLESFQDDDGDGQVKIELLNRGSAEQEMQLNWSAGGEPTTVERTRIQPGQPVQRIIRLPSKRRKERHMQRREHEDREFKRSYF